MVLIYLIRTTFMLDMNLLNFNDIKYIVVHCSATPPNSLIGMEEINRWHKALGWNSIGYHFVIRRNLSSLGGLVEVGRPLNYIGSHVSGYNSKSIGVCMVGGINNSHKSENNFSTEQFIVLEKVLKFLIEIFPKAMIQGHRDFPNVKKDCPCFDVKKWWNERI